MAKYVYELRHIRLVQIDKRTGQKIYDTKILGFFSSEEKCEEMISLYLEQPGFKEYPDNFMINEIKADVDAYNDILGEFDTYVYFLSHEWYDGEYDYISYLGYYSDLQKAEEAEQKYCREPELVEHPEGFCIDRYEINRRKWTEGFFSYNNMECL